MQQSLEKSTRYHIKRLLGAGGMGVTYLAAYQGSEGFEKQVVVKRLHPHLTHHPAMIQALIEEARLAVLLEHPHIVSTYDFLEERDGHSLVMEYVDGCTLSFWMQAVKRLEPEVIFCIVMQLLLALDYAHKRKDATGQPLHIIHRDISPDNVLLSHNGIAKLTDFGLAKIRPKIEQTKPGTIKGKYGYMSPEQARGQTLDQRTDLYAVGILLYEGLTGERLFKAEHPLHLLHLAAQGSIPPVEQSLPNIHPTLAEIIHKALHLDPAQRFQDAASFYDALEVFLLPWSVEKLRRRLEERLLDFLAEKSLSSHDSFSALSSLPPQSEERSASSSIRESATQIQRHFTSSQNQIDINQLKRPLVYVLCGDGVFTEALCKQMSDPWQGKKQARFLLLQKKEQIEEALEGIRSLHVVPRAVFFGGLHVALHHPLLEALQSHAEVAKLLVLEQPNSEIIEIAAEICGLDALLYAPLSLETLHRALDEKLHLSDLSQRIRTLQQRLTQSNQSEIELRQRADALAAANIRAVHLLEEIEAKHRELQAKDHFIERVSRAFLDRDPLPEDCFMHGNLQEMPLTDIFQLLNLSRKNAMVSLSREKDTPSGILLFQQGEIVDARYDRWEGEEALAQLLQWSQAEFWLQSLPPRFTTTITRRTDQLLLDLLRRMDERGRLSSSEEWNPPQGDIF